MFQLYEELENIKKHCESCEVYQKKHIEQLRNEIEMYKRFWMETQQRLTILHKAIESENFQIEFTEEGKTKCKDVNIRTFKCKLIKK